jgi:hypothetical protein
MHVPTRPLNIVGFSGNLQRASKAPALVETLIKRIVAARRCRRFICERYAGCHARTRARDGGPNYRPKLEDVIDRLTTGNAIVVGSPLSLEVVADLERDIGQLVLTSYQVAAWHALRTMGVEDSLAGLWPALFTAMSDNASVN